MRIKQLSMFETSTAIETVDDFVEAAFTVYESAKKRGWVKDDFLTHMKYDFESHHGGTAPGAFVGYDFFDYSPKGCRLSNYKTGAEVFFKKDAILKAIKEGGYCD